MRALSVKIPSRIHSSVSRRCRQFSKATATCSDTPATSQGLTSPIYILGVGNVGKFVAHSIKAHAPETPVTYMFHYSSLDSEFKASGKGIRYRSLIAEEQASSWSEPVPIDYEMLNGSPQSPAAESAASQKAAPIENLIVTTKAYQTIPILRSIKDRLHSSSNVLFLQDGIMVPQEVNQVLFPEPEARPKYWAGVCSAVISTEKSFSIVHAGRGSTVLGQTQGLLPQSTSGGPDSATSGASPASGEADALEIPAMITTLLNTPVLEASLQNPTDIYIAQLKNLIVHAVIDPCTALFGCKNGDLLSKPHRVRLMDRLLSEIVPIVVKLLPPREEEKDASESYDSTFDLSKLREMVHSVVEATAEIKSSMLQDIRAARRTDVDSINGYCIEKAKEFGLQADENELVVDILKGGVRRWSRRK